MLDCHVRRQRPAARVGDAQIAVAEHRLAAGAGQHQATVRARACRERAERPSASASRAIRRTGGLRGDREALLNSRGSVGKPSRSLRHVGIGAVSVCQRPRETNRMQRGAGPDRLSAMLACAPPRVLIVAPWARSSRSGPAALRAKKPPEDARAGIRRGRRPVPEEIARLAAVDRWACA